ncbi:non-homologous end-joining DNA ligase [Pseudonocardia sp. CA-107938]|uniref:non-homologous end-joining DNA ligase n=1 Tax=Pseudonocardia sp. CA-107938 TaxID=3240021 RepID=UPI003D8E3450
MADPPVSASGGVLPGGFVAPMLPTVGPVPTGSGWAIEIKFDGVRATSHTGPDGLRLWSRNARDISASYPEIAGAGQGLEPGLVLDGELVALDAQGRPDFGLLQHRMGVARPSPALRGQVPVQYVLFDVLGRDGVWLTELPYVQRRSILTGLDLDRPGLRVPANFVDTSGEVVLAAVAQQGLEGVVAKRLSSTYQPGRRTRAWIKTPIRHNAEVVIAGWYPATGAQHVLGSLLLAAHDENGELVHVGDVGTGFTDTARHALLLQLAPLARDDPPITGAMVRGWRGARPRRGPIHWVAPRLVGEIEYRSFGRDRAFRHPSWRGLRPDREPNEVRLPVR